MRTSPTAELLEAFDFSATERFAVREVARLKAIIEAIERALDDRGVVGKSGKSGYLLDHRARVSRQLRVWLGDISGTMEQQEGRLPPSAERPIDVLAELENEIRSSKPNPVRVSALLALDRVRRQPPDPITGGGIPAVVRQLF